MSGNAIASAAEQKIGCPYVHGAAGPNSFDCSGLVMWCHKQAGINLPRTASGQAAHPGTTINDWGSFQRGDVVFFDTAGRGGVSHVGISLGGDTFIHAPEPGKSVVKVTANPYYWKKASVFKGGKRFW